MLVAVREHIRSLLPNANLASLYRGGSRDAVLSLGYEPVEAWQGGHPLLRDWPAILARVRPRAVVVIGADVMDGHYHPVNSLDRFSAADLAVRAGLPCVIAGFSFNSSPAPEIVECVKRLDPKVRVNLRDPASRGRWNRFYRRKSFLTADVAFELSAAHMSTLDRHLVEWIDGQRTAGRKIIGFNVHRGVTGEMTGSQNDHLTALAASIRRIIADGTSVLFLPHDYRESGDLTYLSALAGIVHGPHAFLLEKETSAAGLKRIASLLDGVVSGRMHLAVAALGMGLPALCFDYQDKFAGLFKHFRLSDDFLLKLNDDAVAGLADTVAAFVLRSGEWSAIIEDRLPAIQGLARRNYLGIAAALGSVPIKGIPKASPG